MRMNLVHMEHTGPLKANVCNTNAHIGGKLMRNGFSKKFFFFK